ncbi:MAG: hypothetical protein ACTSXW_02180 [Candidatus Baldrarchaeia archaeon]
MNTITAMLLYSLAGFTMKLTDEGAERGKIDLALMFIFSGLSIGFLFSLHPGANMIFVAIILGTGMTGKIDNRYHLLGLLTICLTVALLGIPKEWNIVITFILTVSAFLDELSDYFSKKIREIYIKIWEHRPFLKIACIILISYLQWNALGLLLFDFFYEIAYILVKHLYSK